MIRFSLAVSVLTYVPCASMSRKRNELENMHHARVKLASKLYTLAGVQGEGEGHHDDPFMSLFEESLTHSSSKNETGQKDNQRLEFLGDAIVGLCITEILIASFQDVDEGVLTRMRSQLVNAENLAKMASKLDLGTCIRFGRGAQSECLRANMNVLADAFEALVASVYSVFGLEGTRRFVRSLMEDELSQVEKLSVLDPKSAFQEAVQALGYPTPRYEVIQVQHIHLKPRYEIGLYVGDLEMARAVRDSKRAAERDAAEKAFELLPTLMAERQV